jgi:hypothetical protein
MKPISLNWGQGGLDSDVGPHLLLANMRDAPPPPRREQKRGAKILGSYFPEGVEMNIRRIQPHVPSKLSTCSKAVHVMVWFGSCDLARTPGFP